MHVRTSQGCQLTYINFCSNFETYVRTSPQNAEDKENPNVCLQVRKTVQDKVRICLMVGTVFQGHVNSCCCIIVFRDLLSEPCYSMWTVLSGRL